MLLVMVVASVPWALVVVQVPLVLCAVSDVGLLAVLERQFSEWIEGESNKRLECCRRYRRPAAEPAGSKATTPL